MINIDGIFFLSQTIDLIQFDKLPAGNTLFAFDVSYVCRRNKLQMPRTDELSLCVVASLHVTFLCNFCRTF